VNRTWLRNAAKSALYRFFRTGQRLGFDVLPRHFYSSIPDFRELSRDTRWKAPRSLVGVHGTDPEEQLAFLRSCCTPELRQRLATLDVNAYARGQYGDEGYGPIEAEMLYCFMASKRPRRVIQVGAGYSTAVMLLAAQDWAEPPQLTCIDPYPSDYLKRLAKVGDITLINQRAQDVELEKLSSLDAGDLLFIDSTHTVKVGSEVNLLILEVLPRLQPGTYVQFHDIFFPYDYHRDLETLLFFPLESTLLHAFLAQNPHYTIRTCLSMLHYARPAELQAIFSRYRPSPNDEGLPRAGQKVGHFPSSIYLQAI
jgi:predicted O-methyltransferase YrrM